MNAAVHAQDRSNGHPRSFSFRGCVALAIILVVNHKSSNIAALIHSHGNRGFDAHYLGYFECFNRQLFFEAHEVLEELWLAQRGQPDDLFYKGLIQLAGAFVHIQKQRRGPALALLNLARINLRRYPTVHQSLDLAEVLRCIGDYMQQLEAEPKVPIESVRWPKLIL